MTRARMRPGARGWGRSAPGLRAALALLPFLAAGASPGGGRAAAQERPDGARSASPPPGTLVVHLADEEGTPVEEAGVWASPAAGGGRAAPARGDGRDSVRLRERAPGTYRATGLAPGRWRVRAAKMGHRPSVGWARVRGGEGSLLRLPLPRDPVPLDEVRTGADRPSWSPGPGRTVDHVRLGAEGSGPRSLAAWLASLEGVEVRRRGAGGREVASVRGSRPEGVRVLLDGVPVNDPITGVADLSRIPAGSLESATLVRGASAAAGSGGLAGILVLRSADRGEEGARLGVEAGSFGERAVDLRASVAGGAGSLTVTGRVEAARNDYPFRNRVAPGGPTAERRNADVRARHATVAAVSPGGDLRLRARLDDVERGTPGRMGTRMFDRARWRDRSVQASLGFDPAPGLELVGGVQGFTTRYADPRRGVDDRRTGGTARVRGTLRTEAGWAVTGRLSREWVAGDGIQGARGRVQAGGALARTFGGDPLRLRAVLAADLSPAGVVWSPEVALETTPEPDLRIWARAGRGYRLPTLADLHLTPATGVSPTPDLRPERVTLDLEAGAEWASRSRNVRLRAAAFRRRASDPILWLAQTAALWRPRNADGLSARGLEATARWRPARPLTLGAGLTAQRSRVRVGESESPLPYAAAVEGRAVATWRWEGGSLRTEWHMTGARPTRLAGSRRLPPFALLDVAARRTFRMGELPVELELTVRNLLDVRYELVELFPEPGRELEIRVGFGPVPPERDP